ncbi:hypothetical protein AXG93_2175s1390 [Marchantia polymorpha subsp. ruderalis]|uniref:Uncharacterized protein n=1 Tax=Marchantia polymorpha subsp. ruderalis TaxID=1480154 RepID=A0A176W8R2_MARPO|nr:hypothetical protein AXG93_2175s1390 [Marchantia polymorpha subsp. ruderalis]
MPCPALPCPSVYEYGHRRDKDLTHNIDKMSYLVAQFWATIQQQWSQSRDQSVTAILEQLLSLTVFSNSLTMLDLKVEEMFF